MGNGSGKGKFYFRLGLLFILLAGLGIYFFGRSLWVPVKNRIVGKKTEESAVAEILKRRPQVAQMVPEKTAKMALVVFKKERQVELWADGRRVKSYRMTAFSGDLGPKLEEGDGQIPEGIYGLVYLNPNSSYHLSIKVDYPNAFDREQGRREKREFLGDDIFIHGKEVSIGCVAIGDEGIEEVFCAVRQVGLKNTVVIIAPYDMRKGRDRQLEKSKLSWAPGLYDRIAAALAGYPRG